MSYDLYVFRAPVGHDPNEVFEQEMEIEEGEGGDEPISDADLDRCQEEVSRLLGDDASCYRCGGHVSINIPFHHEGAEAKRLFVGLAECLQRTCVQHGLTVYDPQESRPGHIRRGQHDNVG